MLDLLERKITAPGILVFFYIASFTVFLGQWEKILLLFFLWLAAAVALNCGSINTQDMANFCMYIVPVSYMLDAGTVQWRAAAIAVLFILINLYNIYNKLFVHAYVNIVMMIVFMAAGSLVADYVKLQQTDLWFFMRMYIWGGGTLIILANYNKEIQFTQIEIDEKPGDFGVIIQSLENIPAKLRNMDKYPIYNKICIYFKNIGGIMNNMKNLPVYIFNVHLLGGIKRGTQFTKRTKN